MGEYEIIHTTAFRPSPGGLHERCRPGRVDEQTALAQRQAGLAAQRLEAEVGRPADAEAYRQRTLAEAARDQVKFEADGSAYAERTLAQAQAEANTARAVSLREGNQELIAANRIVENLPALADAAARGMSGASLTVLNGTDGVNEVAAGVVGQGLAILQSLQRGTDTGAPEDHDMRDRNQDQGSDRDRTPRIADAE